MVTFERLPDVRRATGQSTSAIYRNCAAGLMCPPVKLGPKTSAWILHEVREVNAARAAGWSDDQIRDLVSRLVAQRGEYAPRLAEGRR